MVRALSKLALTAVMSVASIEAIAWTPCAPFCDMECGGPALATLGSTVQSGLNSTAFMLALENETIVASISSVGGAADLKLSAYSTFLAEGFSALVGGFQAAVQAQTATEAEYALEDSYGPTSVPATYSVDEGISRRALGKLAQDVREEADDVYLEARDQMLALPTIRRMPALSAELVETSAGDFVKSVANRGGEGHTASMSQVIQVLGLQSESIPRTGEDDVTAAIRAALRMSAVNAMASISSNYEVLGETKLIDFAVDDQPGPASVSTYLFTMPQSRVDSENWARSLYLLNEAGLRRELTYLLAEEGALRYYSYGLTEMETLMTVLLAASQQRI